MSEALVKAILNLLVIVIKSDGVITKEEREKVEELLGRALNAESLKRFMAHYDARVQDPIPTDELEFDNHLKKVCDDINRELIKKQKIMMLRGLYELVLTDGELSEAEDILVKRIGELIKVDPKDVELLRDFEMAQGPDEYKTSDILLLTGEEFDGDVSEKVIHQKVQGLKGVLSFLHVASSDVIFIRYRGTAEMQLNNVSLTPNSLILLPPGSAIRSQGMSPVYYSDIVNYFFTTNTDLNISFEAKDISFRFPNGNLGLRNINVSENSGKMIGLMGASGAGKSTLLNVLNGSLVPSEGQISINGINIHSEEAKTRVQGVIGYVPQDDLLIEDLTVYQNLYFAAKLCFKDLDEKEVDELVKKTLQNLGLLETKDLRVGSPLEKTISGGQRKRLNIGLELLREPAILFADEPTSGLSSRDSENIMDLLKELSLKGKLVFVVIHQPSSDIFKMFDKLVILDVGGYQIYYGNPVEAVLYFKNVIDMANKNESACVECGNVNPEQIFNIIETKVIDEFGKETKTRKISPEEWNKFFNEKIVPEKVEDVAKNPPSSLRIPKLYNQFNIFLIRDLLSKLGNKQYMLINLLEAPLLAFLLAFIIRYFAVEEGVDSTYIFAKNVNLPSYMFMSIIVSLFMGLTVSAEEIIRDRKILKREAFLHLSKGSYLSSKIVLLFCLTAFQSYIFVLVGNYILGIQGMFIVYWLVLFSCGCFANVLGLNISAAFNSAVTIYILIPILLIPQLLLSGAVVRFDKLNPWVTNEATVPLVGDMMASRWALEAMMVTQFQDNRFESKFFEIDKEIADSEYKQLYYLPKLFTKLEYVNGQFLTGDMESEKVHYDLEVLRREITKELKIIGQDHFDQVDRLTPEEFTKSLSDTTRAFLDGLVNYYKVKHNKAIAQRGKVFEDMNSSPEKRSEFEDLRNNYQNESVLAIVSNAAEPRRIVERNGTLIRKVNTIYMRPRDHSHIFDFRAPFYVAEKYFAGTYFPTFGFNIMVIWTMTIILGITLYYDVLRRIVSRR